MLAVQINLFAFTAFVGQYFPKLLAYQTEILPEHTFGLVDYKYLMN